MLTIFNLAVATDSDNDLESSTAVSAPVITKEAILELYMFCKSNPSCTYYTLWKWLACLFKDKWSEESFPTIKSVRQSEQIEENDISWQSFLFTDFIVSTSAQDEHEEHIDDEHDCGRISDLDYCCFFSCRSRTLQEIAFSLELKNQILSESHQKRYAIHRNMMKKVKWRDYLIQQQEVEVKEERIVTRSLQEKVVVSEALISSVKMKVDRVLHTGKRKVKN